MFFEPRYQIPTDKRNLRALAQTIVAEFHETSATQK